MYHEAVALCTVLLLACASAGAPLNARETDVPSRSLLQLYTEKELQQELDLVKQHIANLHQQLLAHKGATTDTHSDDAAATTMSDQDTSSMLAASAQMPPADTDIFTFDFSQDQQAPPVNLSQRRAGLLRILSRIAESDPHLIFKAALPGTSDITSSSDRYLPESAQLLGPGYLQMGDNLFKAANNPGELEAQLKVLLTKLKGRSPRVGVKESLFIPRTESAMLAPQGEQSSKEATHQANAVAGKLLDHDASTANTQLVSLLSRVNGISGSIIKAAADKEFRTRSEAAELSVASAEALADTADATPSKAGTQEEFTKDTAIETAVQDTTMSGKGPYYGSTSVVPASGSVQLADANEIHAEQALKVKVLDPVTITAATAADAMSFQDIQKTATDVADAVAAAGGTSSSSNAPTADSDATTFLMPIGSATDTADVPPHANVQTLGQKGLSAGSVAGIAVGTFIAVLSGAGLILMWQARQIQKEVASGYTKTAHNEDVESASKVPAVCASPAFSMGGAIPSAGGAPQSSGCAANWQELSSAATTAGVQDSFTPISSGTGYLRTWRHSSWASSSADASAAAVLASGALSSTCSSMYTIE